MAIDLTTQWRETLPELRIAPTRKRLRAMTGGEVVLDTHDALLVWEPRRVVPQYAVPPQDLFLELEETAATPLPDSLPPLMPPGSFTWHTTPGTALVARHGGTELGEVAFRPDDPALGGRIVVDFHPFDWLEEEQAVISHPHDPFKRIDILPSSRRVRVELDGVVLAESDRAVALYETSLPTRWYLPREDVRMELLEPSSSHSTCAYKGVASYLNAEGEAGRDVAWYYPEPLHEAEPVRDLVAFYSERTVTTVDGERFGMHGPGSR
jgi:uncharacterized protein (DUF427 family)